MKRLYVALISFNYWSVAYGSAAKSLLKWQDFKKCSSTKSVLLGLKSNTITCNTSKDGRNVSGAQENTTDSKLLSEFAGPPNERSVACLLGVWEVSKTTLGQKGKKVKR